jgi:hypothetical protein
LKLIITSSIFEAEFQPLENTFPLEAIKAAAKKSWEGLGESIKSSSKIHGTELKKVYLTSSHGAGRAIFLLQLSQEKSVLVMIRHKNDKQIGSNMTVQNPKFKKILEKNIDLILEDLKYKKYQTYDLD